MFRFLKVEGDSLLPRYREGDYVLVASTPFPSGRIKPGSVVAFRHPTHGTLIKLVESVKEGGYHVVGTHPHSVDSRQFGPVRPEALIGKVLWHLRQPAGRAAVPGATDNSLR
jgi:nickel-type superoxide dismutase maturation protease